MMKKVEEDGLNIRQWVRDRILFLAVGIFVIGAAGYIGAESIYDGTGVWHSGAGLGLRYDTTVGPLRLDIAGPLGGDTGDGVQIYIGIGQAF